MKIWLLAVLMLGIFGCATGEDPPHRYPCEWRCGGHYPGQISNEAPPLPKAPGGSNDEPKGSVATSKEAPVLQKAPPEEETLRNMDNVRICEYRRRYTCGTSCFCAADGNLYKYPTYRYYR